DDIADSSELPASEKIAFLSHLQQSLRDGNPDVAPSWAQAYIQDTCDHISNADHGIALLSAFLQDASKNRYLTMQELLDYCCYSAAPVGRVVLECSHETQANLEAADALCTVLQLINHLQDCKEDYQTLNRIYLPKNWMQLYGVSEQDLDAEHASPAMRKLFDRYLQQCRELMLVAAPLPASIHSKRLRLELLLITNLANALIQRLSQQDPLQAAVKVPRHHWPLYMLRSLKQL
ncbi:MAG: squalene/phytoene synthase family protein, partial [Alphaproteobacteria bacterium]|nr:squalene/phytoene synthase family protein [Alphaproteobacteria bacterium]